MDLTNVASAPLMSPLLPPVTASGITSEPPVVWLLACAPGVALPVAVHVTLPVTGSVVTVMPVPPAKVIV
ncbi:hypothetical protein D3C71_2186140 [compost metagenome]